MSREVRILVVDDELIVRESLSNYLREDGYEAIPEERGEEALRKIEAENWNILFVDLKMPGMDGLEVLRQAKKIKEDLPVIIITAYATIDSAVQAMKDGAYDYIVKPFDPEAIALLVEKVVEHQNLVRENILLRERIEREYQFEEIIGKSQPMQEVFEMVKNVAESDTSVLVTGESGTGKELIARAIHSNGPRRYNPFITASCGAMPEGLLESELFGHEKGAFTGALYTRRGRFELADGGTLFLDEIGEISPKTQVNLLRILDEKSFMRVGGMEQITVDVRVVSATNRDLKKAIREGAFREDLFYRLNVVSIQLPPLRERKEDIPLLANHFLGKFRAQTNKRIERISDRAMELMMEHNWPGNVRELENAIERAVVVGKKSEVIPEDLPFFKPGTPEKTGVKALRERERIHILQTLDENGWNISKTAEDLEIDRVTLYNKIKKYNLEKGRTDTNSNSDG
jgi:DNA-binding NtrC family response regulator